MAGKRARAPKKRVDYRKGGRVHAEQGFYADDITRMEQGGYSSPGNLPGSSYDINKVLTGSRYGATNNRAENTVFDNNLRPGGVQETFNPAAVEAGDTSTTTTTTTTPTYTAADVNQAYADLNAGKITAAQLASQYGVSEDYINTNLNAFNAKAAADKAAADKAAADKAAAAAAAAKAPVLAIPADGDYTEAETQVVQDAIASGAISAAEVAAKFGVTEDQVTTEIKRREAVAKGETLPENMVFLPETPIEDRLTDAQKELFDPYATKSPTMDDSPTAQAALQRADEAYQAGDMTYEEWAQVRENFKIEYPYEFRDMDAEAAAEAAEAAAQAKTTAAVADIPVDADYTQFEIDQVYDALQSGAMTVEQVAEQFGATAAQVQAEWDRMKQAKAGETVTGEDPFAEGVYDATKEALDKKDKEAKEAAQEAATTKRKEDLDVDTEEQLKDINLAKKTWLVDNPNTPNIDETEAIGAILKDYKRVDPDLLFDKREAETLDVQEGITTDANIQKLDAYKDIEAPDGVDKNDFDAVTGLVTKAVKAGRIDFGDYEAVVTDVLNTPQFAQNREMRQPILVSEIRKLTQKAQAAVFTEEDLARGKGKRSTFKIDDRAFVPGVTGVGGKLSPNIEAEEKTRDQLTTTAADSVEAEITKMADYEARQRANVTGEAAIADAISAIAEVGNLPPDRAAAAVEKPAEFGGRIDQESPEVIAAFKSLDPDILVSAQIESLLGGMESGNVPSWAKPAYDAVNQKLAQRGLEVSTVGRDALFNAIIQNAIPIAQSNAQALQARATQNLTNEQQANMQRAQTEANRRLANLSNLQAAGSQTAQMSQNIKLAQSQFKQEAVILSEQQQQQIRVQNLQNQQRAADLTAQQAAANAAQNLGNRQQIELAELEIKNQTEQQNMTAQNQERLAEFQVAAEYISKNGDFAQQMQLANLSNDQQTRLANLTSRNQADSDSLTTRQQTELANLNSRMQLNIANANLANQMGVAQLNVDQQKAMQNASMIANIDLTKFNDAQQMELANSKFMQTSSLTAFNARQQAAMQDATSLASLDLAAVDQRTKLRITQAQNFLQRDMANLSNEQQALILDTQMDQQRLLSDVASQNAAKQFNAASENQINQFNENLYAQIEQFNTTQANAMEQFNKAETNRVEAINAGNAIDAEKFNNQLGTQIKQFNEQYDLQRDQWNAANAQAVEQSNVQWRRQANTVDTAAINASNQENASKAFQISAADQSFMWQELRDEAAYLRQAFENEEQRKTTLYATAISNDVGDTGALGIAPIVKIVDDITK